MYNLPFFKTRLGHAALASFVAMAALVTLSPQLAAGAPVASATAFEQAQLA